MQKLLNLPELQLNKRQTKKRTGNLITHSVKI